MPNDGRPRGFYVCTWGGGQYRSIAWCLKEEDAEAIRQRILTNNTWQGMPPRLEPGAQPLTWNMCKRID